MSKTKNILQGPVLGKIKNIDVIDEGVSITLEGPVVSNIQRLIMIDGNDYANLLLMYKDATEASYRDGRPAYAWMYEETMNNIKEQLQ